MGLDTMVRSARSTLKQILVLLFALAPYPTTEEKET